MSDTMIELSDLSRFYGPIKALDQINLQVRRGEVMGFLGPNGAGKTTAMRILAGLLAPTSGSVRVAGMDVIDQPVEARSKIGFLPENPPIYEEMTVREYLAYLAALRRVPANRRKESMERAMERCGLTHVANRLLRNLSKGYRQRAGIAQAIVHSPDVVILDEPTVGLDPIQVREIRALIRELGGEHSVLLSTHILPEVQVTCDRVALINSGRIVAEDSLEGLMKQAHGENRFYLRLAHPPQPETVETIPGIATVDVSQGARWIVTADENADPIPALIRRALDEQWNLREITPFSHTLEEIFVQLTTRENDLTETGKEAAQ